MIDGINLFFPVASEPLVAKEGTDAQPSGTGLPARLLLPVLQHIRADIAEIREAIAEVHMRMVGGSLLVVYEADWESVEEGLKFLDEDEESEDEDEELLRSPAQAVSSPISPSETVAAPLVYDPKMDERIRGIHDLRMPLQIPRTISPALVSKEDSMLSPTTNSPRSPQGRHVRFVSYNVLLFEP